MKEKKSIQVIRGICALLVIFIHSMYLTNTNYDYLNIFFRSITNFSVAAFIFLSGYLTKEEKVSLFYKKKLKRIFVPLLLWDIIYTGISVIFNGIGNSTEILKSFLLSEHSVHLYYLYVLLQLFF